MTEVLPKIKLRDHNNNYVKKNNKHKSTFLEFVGVVSRAKHQRC